MFSHREIDVDGRKQHVVETGQGVPVMLIHGWPQTWYEWRKVAPFLNSDRHVLMPDTRGLGDTAQSDDGYEKHKAASDLITLLDTFEIDRLDLVGHDWGGPIAFAMALLAPKRINTLTVVDVVIPGDGRAGGMAQGGMRWHHMFHRTPSLPENLTKGRERAYLFWFFGEYSEMPDAVDEDALNAYLRSYQRPEVMKAGFEYYRASERDALWNKKQLAEQGKLKMPVLGVSGGAGRGRAGETEESLIRVATNVECHIIPDCGHLVPEEKPEILAKLIRQFWAAQHREN